MSMQAIIGTGKLYDGDGEQVIAIVTHKIWEKPHGENSSGEWGGEFTIDRIIWPSGGYIIELEDGRKGTCLIDIEQSVTGCPVIYRYSLKGCGALTQQKN